MGISLKDTTPKHQLGDLFPSKRKEGSETSPLREEERSPQHYASKGENS